MSDLATVKVGVIRTERVLSTKRTICCLSSVTSSSSSLSRQKHRNRFLIFSPKLFFLVLFRRPRVRETAGSAWNSPKPLRTNRPAAGGTGWLWLPGGCWSLTLICSLEQMMAGCFFRLEIASVESKTWSLNVKKPETWSKVSEKLRFFVRVNCFRTNNVIQVFFGRTFSLQLFSNWFEKSVIVKNEDLCLRFSSFVNDSFLLDRCAKSSAVNDTRFESHRNAKPMKIPISI